MDTIVAHNLPAALTGFVGRTRELGEIGRLLADARLLTLTGVGGTGKTRLAIEAARPLVPAYPDGVWLADLSPLADPALVPQAVATAVGLQGAPGQQGLDLLIRHCRSLSLLLVLDNCEHLLDACAGLVNTLLRACPGVRILATSREGLGLDGEATLPVPPLSLPADAPASPEILLAESEAARLFSTRARDVRADFRVTAANAGAVAAICRQLDGIPLAIELAAARARELTPQEIAGRLGARFRLLTTGSRTAPARQRTLRAAIDWSYDLLPPDQRRLFRHLGVFAGGWSLDAAEAICDGDGIVPDHVLDLLARLIAQSLVLAEPAADGTMRYRLLETLRQYAQERLESAGEAIAVRARHASHFLALAINAESALRGNERAPWLARLAAEQDNLRAALRWYCDVEPDTIAPDGRVRHAALELAGALFWYWTFRDQLHEGYAWAERALAASSPAAGLARAKALYAAGEFAWRLGDEETARQRLAASVAMARVLGADRDLAYALQVFALLVDDPAEAATLARESLALFETAGDAWGAALAAHSVGLLALRRGDYAQARDGLAAALIRYRAQGEGWLAAQALNGLGDAARAQRADAEAGAYYEESRMLFEQHGATGSIPSLLHNLGYLALRRGEPARALELFRSALARFAQADDRRGIAECLIGVGGVHATAGEAVRAARLFGAAQALIDAHGIAHSAPNRADQARLIDAARARLPAATFAAAQVAGASAPLAEIIAAALAADVVPAPASSTPGEPQEDPGWASLTPREREVARCVARGLTNRQIAAELFISAGTASLHVKHILGKLGLSSRTQIAAWVVAGNARRI